MTWTSIRALESVTANKSTTRWTCFLNSPGHRQNILNPHHRNVGIGIYIPTAPPSGLSNSSSETTSNMRLSRTIDAGMLTLSGQVRNGADISEQSLSLIIYYDRPPKPLTQGQLSRTYCYNNGQRIASHPSPTRTRIGLYTSTKPPSIIVDSKPVPRPVRHPRQTLHHQCQTTKLTQ